MKRQTGERSAVCRWPALSPATRKSARKITVTSLLFRGTFGLFRGKDEREYFRLAAQRFFYISKESMDGVDFALCGAAFERLTDEPGFFPSPDHRRQAVLGDNAGGAGTAELTVADGNQSGVSVASQNGVPGHIR